MKQTRVKKSKSLFQTIVERFSYKQRALLTAISLFAVAGILAYLNSGSSAILAAPPLGVVLGNHTFVNLLIAIILVIAAVTALTSMRKKK